MFNYNLKVNNHYVCFYFINDKMHKIIFKRRLLTIYKNKIITFFSNLCFKLKFSKGNMRYRTIYNTLKKSYFKPKFKRFFKTITNKLKSAKNFFSRLIDNQFDLKQELKEFKNKK